MTTCVHKIFSAPADRALHERMVFLLLVLCSYCAMPTSFSFAAINIGVAGNVLGYPVAGAIPVDPTADALKKVLGWMTGSVGKAIATLAIAATGFGALYHRITWPHAFIVSIGVALVFGAASLLNAATGTNGQGAVLTTGTGVCDNISAIGGLQLTTSAIALNRPCEMLRLAVNTISGGIGAAIATMAIIVLGVSALFGKLTYPQALVLALGITLIFGAVTLVKDIWGDPHDCLANDVVNFLMGNEVQFVLCRFLAELRGDAGRFMATFAVIALGFMALMGRLTLMPALVTVLGIVAVFGSDAIVGILVPNAHTCTSISTPDLSLVSGAIEGVLCNIMGLITGVPGKALASSAVVMLGFGAMLGKVSYGAALITATGIAIAFGAPQLVFILTGNVDFCALNISLTGSLNPCSR